MTKTTVTMVAAAMVLAFLVGCGRNEHPTASAQPQPAKTEHPAAEHPKAAPAAQVQVATSAPPAAVEKPAAEQPKSEHPDHPR